MTELGKILIIVGALLLCLGVLITVGGKLPWLGRLPGDIVIQREHFSFYFPIATCVVLSIALSILFALLRR